MTQPPGLRSRSSPFKPHAMPPQAYAPLNGDSDTGTNGKVNVTDFTISIPGSKVVLAEGSPPRWHTKEFKFYSAAFVLVVPLLVYWPMRLSSSNHPNYDEYAHKLSPGWLFGRQVDDSDPQYHSFRSNLPALLLLGSSYLALSALQTRVFKPSPSARIAFINVYAIIMLLILHGLSTFKILGILYANYALAKLPKHPSVAKFWPAMLIVGNMVLLFFNHKYQGYHLGDLHPALGQLDEFQGVLPRWFIGFNITMLRIISFGLDYHWQESSGTPSPASYRDRVKTSLPTAEYTFLNFVAYCLYPPLYIAGPIITFNDFMWQVRAPLTISTREKVSYSIRFIFCLLTMESVLHTMYVVAIKDTGAWQGDSAADLSIIGFWNLVVVWLKLLIPWRFFRLWALLDGMDPPENMIRCVANNYSTLGFWRSWHRSYNLWIIRYIYIPVGGARNPILAYPLVFTFVALWHDLSFKLLAWGWMVTLFILPEVLARQAIPAEKYGKKGWYRHLAAIGGVVNLLMMMTANLVGFVLGLDGMKHLLTELTTTAAGWRFMAFACGCLFVAIQVMFEYREEELRRGVERKC